jgi:hypothetical protein
MTVPRIIRSKVDLPGTVTIGGVPMRCRVTEVGEIDDGCIDAPIAPIIAGASEVTVSAELIDGTESPEWRIVSPGTPDEAVERLGGRN